MLKSLTFVAVTIGILAVDRANSTAPLPVSYTRPRVGLFAYLHARGSNAATGKKAAIVSEVFSYCTPTHDIYKIAHDEESDYKAMVLKRIGGAGSVSFGYDAGNSSMDRAEKARQERIKSLSAAGYVVEQKPFSIAIYAPAAECRS